MNRLLNSLSLMLVLGLLACNDFADVTVSYTKGTAIYGNMASIRNTELISTSQEIIDPGKIFVSDNYLFVGEEGQGIHIIDNTDKENPNNIAFINIPGNREYFFSNNMLYAESYYDMLKIDLTNPLQPILLTRLENAIAEEIKDDQGRTLLGFKLEDITEKVSPDDDIYSEIHSNGNYQLYFDYQQNLIPQSAVPASFSGNSSSNIGSVNRVISHEDHVYMVSRNSLLVFSDDGEFQLLFKEYYGQEMETVYPMGSYLFIGAQSEVIISDISDPGQPMRVGQFWHATSCDPVYPTENGVAYVTLRTGDFAECPGDQNALIVLDIETIHDPQNIQEIVMQSPYGLTMSGDKLYVGEGDYGFRIFDASNPKNLIQVEWIKNVKAYDVLLHPTDPQILLIAGPNGLSQYKFEGSTMELLSSLDY